MKKKAPAFSWKKDYVTLRGNKYELWLNKNKCQSLFWEMIQILSLHNILEKWRDVWEWLFPPAYSFCSWAGSKMANWIVQEWNLISKENQICYILQFPISLSTCHYLWDSSQNPNIFKSQQFSFQTTLGPTPWSTWQL